MTLTHLRGVPLVYFVQAQGNGPIKIGYTTDVAQRFAWLRAHNAYFVTLVGLVVDENAKQVGRALQRRFARYRIHDEWFSPSDGLTRYIRTKAKQPSQVGGSSSVDHALAQPLDADAVGEAEQALINKRQLAERVGVSVSTIDRQIRRRTIPYVKIGGQVRFYLPDVISSISASTED